MKQLKLILFLFFLGSFARAQIALPSMRGIFNSKIVTSMYSGGMSSGAIEQLVMQSNCIPESIETIYYGGSGLGYVEQTYLQNTCSFPLLETIYYGGEGSGHAAQTLTQSVCLLPALETIYYGGIGYGAIDQQLIQSICALPILETVYFGGQSASYVNPNKIQTDCLQNPLVTTTSIPFQRYYDLDTGILCSDHSCSMFPSQNYDLTFPYGGTTVHARMWWNEQYSDMALVYDKTFDQLTTADIGNYYYCEHINDGNTACVNTDTPPTNFVGIYKTNLNNYYVVQYLSESTTEVTFKYRKLN